MSGPPFLQFNLLAKLESFGLSGFIKRRVARAMDPGFENSSECTALVCVTSAWAQELELLSRVHIANGLRVGRLGPCLDLGLQQQGIVSSVLEPQTLNPKP